MRGLLSAVLQSVMHERSNRTYEGVFDKLDNSLTFVPEVITGVLCLTVEVAL